MISFTEEDIREIADSSAIIQRGKSYYRSGRVKSVNVTKRKITAKVLGNYGNYKVEITSSGDGHFYSSCNCPYDGSGCKHIVAVMCAVSRRPKSELEKKLEQTPKIHWNNFTLERIAERTEISSILLALDLVLKQRVIIKKINSDIAAAEVDNSFQIMISSNHWRFSSFDQCSCRSSSWGKHCEHVLAALLAIYFKMNLTESPEQYKEELEHQWQEENSAQLQTALQELCAVKINGEREKDKKNRKYELVFNIRRKEEGISVAVEKIALLKSGISGQTTPLRLNYYRSKISGLSPAQKKLLDFFQAVLEKGSYDPRDIDIFHKEKFENALDFELLHHLREAYQHEPQSFLNCTIPAEKAVIEFHVEEKSELAVFSFRVNLKINNLLNNTSNNSITIPLDRSCCILRGDSLWVFQPGNEQQNSVLVEVGCCGQEDTWSEKLAKLEMLLRCSGAYLPAAEIPAFLERSYCSLSQFGAVVLPAQYAVQEELNICPQPRLFLREKENGIVIELRYLYGLTEVALADQREIVTKKEDGTIIKIVRNYDKEAEWQQIILQHGVIFNGKEFILTIPSLEWLVDQSKELIAQGFEIYGQQNLIRHKIRDDEPELKIDLSSGIDWFDLKTNVSFGEENVALWKIVEALNKQERFVKLSDESMGIIPRRWIEKLAGISGLLAIDQKNNSLKAHSSQIQIIETLLDLASAKKVDEKFSQFQKKFQQFKEIKNVPLPQNFKGELRPYQKAGYDWFYFLQEFSFGGCLADEMGLGKTIQVLAMLLKEKEKNEEKTGAKAHDGKVEMTTISLVVVPTSLIFNWQQEIKKFAPNLIAYVHHGSERKGSISEFWDNNSNSDNQRVDLIITTYGTLKNDLSLFKEKEFHYLILDESQNIKNPLTQSAKSIYSLRGKHRLALTGTPIENNTLDLWSQFAFLNPGLLGNLDYFKNTFAKQIEQEKDVEKSSALKHLTAPFLLLRKKEMVAKELPQKQITTLYCEMSKEQRIVYETWKEKFRQEINQAIQEKGMNASRIKIIQGLTILREICNHPSLIDESFAGGSGKMSLLLEQIQEVISQGHKVLIFSSFVKMLTLLRRSFDKNGLRYSYLDGQTKNRQRAVQEFQEDKSIPLFLISIKAGGLGLNLTAADYVFIVDPWWNPAVEMQAIDRAHRIGQKNNVFVYKAVTKDSVEEKIIELQESKIELVKNVIAVEENIFKKLDKEMITKLFT